MNRRKFVFTSTILMVLIAGVVTGLALYSTYIVRASLPGLPEAVAYLPAESHAVFGMNVRKFVDSPIYAKFEEKHGQKIAGDLADFIAKTGVDPRRDLTYVVAAGRAVDHEGKGAIIAVGRFNTAAITSFIHTYVVPIRVDYKETQVLMFPEKNGTEVEKGVAYLSESEIALGDLESLKEVIDVRSGGSPGILNNATLAPMLKALNPEEMFWFAGDAATILANAPAHTPFVGSISSVQTVMGTVNLTDAVNGRITATAKDEDSARKLADVARGFVALGQLAGNHQADLSELIKGISVTQDRNAVRLMVNFPFDLLEKLEQGNFEPKRVL
jgi:hypothetical protein